MRAWTWRDWCLLVSVTCVVVSGVCVAMRPGGWPLLVAVGFAFAMVCRAYWAQRRTEGEQVVCAHCGRRIRDGLRFTHTNGPIVQHFHGDRPDCRAASEAAAREPVHPGGRGCAPGFCPICGMDDPVGLEPCWGGLMAHQDCAEWLNEAPRLDRAQQRELIHHFPLPPVPPLHVDPLLIRWEKK